MACINPLRAFRHPNVRIEAHKVYNEYIQDKQHIHMNATKFLTLSEYVKYLGREGFCTVEESPKGWFIRLIHRDVQQARSVFSVVHCCCRCATAAAAVGVNAGTLWH